MLGYKHLLLWLELDEWYVLRVETLVAHPLGVDLGREEVVGALSQARAHSAVGWSLELQLHGQDTKGYIHHVMESTLVTTSGQLHRSTWRLG